ncbi:type II secretion system protein, partial [bacterium]|nr:type II secretion system protein [bacterium]
ERVSEGQERRQSGLPRRFAPRNDESCHSEHLLCHPELVSGAKKQILNQVQNDRGKCNFFAPCNHRGINNHKELINLSTYLLIHFKKAAFTLAEVLITLGIIGVVAAMTIPTLMANIRGMQYRNQFKKTVSTLNQAVRMAQAQYDFNFADLDNPFGEGMDECAKQDPEQVKTICSLFNGTLSGATYLGTVDDNEDLKNAYEDKFDNNFLFWSFADGSLLILNKSQASHGSTTNGQLLTSTNAAYLIEARIDVNGISKPNKYAECSDGNDLDFDEGGLENPCIVKNKDIHDIYKIYLYDSTVTPANNASAYVFNTAK